MKYLVTGGAGFIGSHVCEALLARGDPVICVDNLNDYYNPKIKENNVSGIIKNKNFTLYKTDIAEYKGLQELFESEKPDKVIHLAARAGVRASIEQPFLYAQTNLTGTMNLLELAKQYKIRNFIFASSSSVYGDRPEVPFRETDRVDDPISPYAATKKAGELLCYTYHHLYHIPITCLRFFTVYGPRGRPDMSPHKFITSVLTGKAIDKYGDGSSERDYTYVADIVKGVISAVDKEQAYTLINLGNAKPVTLNQYISIVEKVVGKKAVLNQKPMQPGDVEKTYADITLAKKMLNWEPTLSLQEGLRKQFEHIQKNLPLYDLT
ncbi:MAG: GDP-mannose 4,6-dehydratase [Nanoarchaeota archaeon]